MLKFTKFSSFILYLLFLFFNTVLIAQEKPYATIGIAKDVYIDQTEVDVGSWLSYYTWVLIHEGFEDAIKVLPDSTAIEPELWAYIKNKSRDYIDFPGRSTLQPIGYFSKECRDCEKFGKRLRSNGKYCAMLDFPITGLTFEQVKQFCVWRTKVQGHNKLLFRLPTPEEWSNIAMKALSDIEDINGFRDSLNNKACPKYNFQFSSLSSNNDYQGKLNAIGMYTPEKEGTFDLFGNVSEMTSIKGISKGGSFISYAIQCHPDSIQTYTKPEPWLGFRCIAVINNNNNPVEYKQVTDSLSNTSINNKFTDPRDGKIYPLTTIGNQTWFAANLAYKPDSGKYWAWNNDEKYVTQFGYLYNWETSKNVCPSGWHLPSKNEFDSLLLEYGGAGKIAYNELRLTGSSGLSLFDCGLRYGVNFSPIEGGAAFWSSTENSKGTAWGLGFGEQESIVNLFNTYKKSSGLPIRCIKD